MSALHVLTVGWDQVLVDGLCTPIAAKSRHRFSHILHPRHSALEFRGRPDQGLHFFRESPRDAIPEADYELLRSLEAEGVPTVHNMVLGDRVVSALEYREALGYATFLARRLAELFDELKPSVVISGFDGIHAGIALAVAKQMGVPWFALNFSVIPPGLACLCDGMSPAARVQLPAAGDAGELRAFAEASLLRFESGTLHAPAYVDSHSSSIAGKLGRIPGRMTALVRTIRNSQQRDILRFTDTPGRVSVSAAVRSIRRAAAARKAVSTSVALATPPSSRYILFGLHMQPESSIDVWAPFFSNQMWVIELLSRSIPPSHQLLVKIHKSDLTNYSGDQYEQMQALPGVKLVRPFVDSRTFIDRADLVVSIQGTMGLEAALLGKPVIMLGDSPVTKFPSASSIREIQDLPELIRRKFSEPPPTREQIVQAYASYLAPFAPASHNDWRLKIGEREIEGYVRLFDRLQSYLAADFAHLDA
ncbi:MAG: hypothetical protein WD944_02685 [Steroidobacteraceae bacterium]